MFDQNKKKTNRIIIAYTRTVSFKFDERFVLVILDKQRSTQSRKRARITNNTNEIGILEKLHKYTQTHYYLLITLVSTTSKVCTSTAMYFTFDSGLMRHLFYCLLSLSLALFLDLFSYPLCWSCYLSSCLSGSSGQ